MKGVDLFVMAVADLRPTPFLEPHFPSWSNSNHESENPLEELEIAGSSSFLKCLPEIRLLLDTSSSSSKHVQNSDVDLGEGDVGVSHFADLQSCEKVNSLLIKALTKVLSPSNAIGVRNVSFQLGISKKVSLCDTFIRKNFSKMLSERELLNLPRTQVNVDVSRSSNNWSTDTNVMEQIVPSVVRELADFSLESKGQLFGEELVCMELMSDFSVQMAGSKTSERYLTPEKLGAAEFISRSKKQPSPARKLQLGDPQGSNGCVDDMDANSNNTWSVLTSHALSGISAIILITHPRFPMMVLNVLLSNASCPISPTTGVPIQVENTLFSQMLYARSGFGLISLPNDSLMSVGGFDRNGVLSSCEKFDFRANSWLPCGELCSKRARFAAVECEGIVFALGGSDGKKELNSIEEFSEGTWKMLSSKLSTARSDFGAVSLNGVVYIVGGSHYSIPLKSVEAFNVVKKQWKSVPPMLTSRKGAAVVSCGGKIYAIGGQTSSWNCLNTVECYNPTSNLWEGVSKMSTPRRNATAVTIDDQVFVIGGYNGSSAINSVERYNPIDDEWTLMDSMAVKRSSAAAMLINNAVYVVGGFTGTFFSNSVEKMDLESGQWTSYFSI